MRLSPSCLIPVSFYASVCAGLSLVLVLVAPSACSDSDAGGAAATTSDAAPSSSSDSSDRDRDDGDAGDAVSASDAANDTDSDTTACRAGETLRDLRTACPGAPLTVPPTLASALTNATAGDVISLGGLDEGTAPCAPAAVCTPSDAATLLFSDSPESPLQDGVLYADTVPAGHYRFYVYHANGSPATRKFPVVVLNQGTQAATISIVRSGRAAPSTAYVSVGKTVLLDWFTDKPVINVPIPAGARVLLDPALDALHANQNELVHAIYDVTTSAPLKVSFVSVLADADAAATTGALSLLPRDADHQRGTFPNADVTVRLTTPLDQGVRHLRFGGDETDATLTGTDATTGDAQKLLGNYGMFYRVDTTSPATSNSFAAIAPRGGSWGGVGSTSGPKLGTLIPPTALPKNTEQLGTTTDAIAIGSLSGNVTDEVRLMTGGGSNLPIDLVLVTP